MMNKTLQDSFLHELGNIASECSYLLVQKHFPETLRQDETLDEIQIKARENVAYCKYLNLDKKVFDVDSCDFYKPSPLMDEIENNVMRLKDDETEISLYVRSLLWPFKIYGEVFYLCEKTKEKAWEYVTEDYIFKFDVVDGKVCQPNRYVGNVEMTLFLVQTFVSYFARRLADILALRHYSLMKIQERYGLFIALFEKTAKKYDFNLMRLFRGNVQLIEWFIAECKECGGKNNKVVQMYYNLGNKVIQLSENTNVLKPLFESLSNIGVIQGTYDTFKGNYNRYANIKQP